MSVLLRSGAQSAISHSSSAATASPRPVLLATSRSARSSSARRSRAAENRRDWSTTYRTRCGATPRSGERFAERGASRGFELDLPSPARDLRVELLPLVEALVPKDDRRAIGGREAGAKRFGVGTGELPGLPYDDHRHRVEKREIPLRLEDLVRRVALSAEEAPDRPSLAARRTAEVFERLCFQQVLR